MPVAYVSLWRVSESLHNDLHSKLNDLAGSLPPLIHNFVTFCGAMWPYLLPPVLAILLESSLSLRTWIAVQKSPYPRRIDSSPPPSRLRNLRKHALTHFAPVYFLFVSLLSSYLHCVANVPQDKLRIVEAVMLGPLFSFATFRLFGLLFRMYALSVRRDVDGDPRIIRTLRPSVPRVLLIVPLSLALLTTFNAIQLDDSICKAVVHVSLIHIFVSLNARSRESIRAAGVYALTNIATLLALTVFLALQAKRIGILLNTSFKSTFPAWDEFNSSKLTSDPDNTDVDYSKYAIEDPNGYRWPLFVLAVLWNVFPIELIALCYRFDYMRFVRLQGLSTASGSGSYTTGGNVDILERKEDSCAHGPSLTHDMLSDTTMKSDGRDVKVRDVGPIYLAPEVPDSFYTRLAPPPYPASHRENTSDHTPNTPSEGEGEGEVEQTRSSMPLPRSLSIFTPTHPHTRLPIPFPTFFTSLSAYLSSTLLLSLSIYLAAQEQQQDALKCLVPLLPLVTLPLTTFSVPLGLAFAPDGEATIKDLWRYEENWRSIPVPETTQGGERNVSGTDE